MFTYVIGLQAEREGYNGVRYFGMEFWGQGVESIEEGERVARQAAEKHACSSLFETGRFRLQVRKSCQTCKVTGIKPGTKKKKCQTCSGWGGTDVAEFVFEVSR